MTVCRFFQQGYCRFGQNCRYDHIFGSKYTYHANPPEAGPPQPAGCTDEQLVTQVQTDMQSALRGGQWLLSGYCPYKERSGFPGINDLSPEEARLFIYEAKNTNNLEQAINFMNNLFKEAKQKYEQLLNPNQNIIQVLRKLYNGEEPTSPFSNAKQKTFPSANSASSIFQRAVQDTNTAASVFSQGNNSIFGSQPDPAIELFSNANNTNVFGISSPSNAFGSPNQTAQSIFASAVQSTNTQLSTNNLTNPSNLFAAANQNIFGSPPSQNTSHFGHTQTVSNQTQNSSPFAQAQNSSPFGQAQNSSPFGQAHSNAPMVTAQTASSFGANNFQQTERQASVFGQATKQLDVRNDPGVFSKIEELTEVDLEAFKSDSFELGFVPEMPPPLQLCCRG